MFKKIIHTLFLATITTGCIEESSIDIIVPYDLYLQEINGGDSLLYPITIYSQDDLLTSVEIRTSNSIDGTQQHLFKELNSQQEHLDFTYYAPKYERRSVATIISILATNSSGDAEMLGLAVTVVSGNEPLTDLANIQLFSAASGRENGYSFELSQLVNSQQSEPEYVDLYEYDESTTTEDNTEDESHEIGDTDDKRDEIIPGTTTESPTLEWRSMTGRRFARLNGFNYDDATYNSVVEGYGYVDKFDTIDEIAVNDIIFIGYDDITPIALIRINAINDNEGRENDYYDISIKYLDNLEEEESGDGNDENGESEVNP